jgi:hypothetical protein
MIRKSSFLAVLTVVCAFLLSPTWTYSSAGAQTTVNQGAPGKQGPWLVTLSGSSGSGTMTVQGATCSVKDNHVSVSTTATACPPAQQAGRRSVLICNSAANTGTGYIRVRADGTAPTTTLASPGTVLTKGTCMELTVAASVTPQCISDVASTVVTTVECY